MKKLSCRPLPTSTAEKPPKNKKVWGPSPHFHRPHKAGEVSYFQMFKVGAAPNKVKMTQR